MCENHVRSKSIKFTADNEFVNNYWQCIMHYERTDQVKKSKIYDDEEIRYNAAVF